MAGETSASVCFGELLEGGTRNGVYKSKDFHGRGAKIINMGELFAHPRLGAVPMKRVNLSDEEVARFAVRPGDLLFARRSLVADGAGKCTIVREIDEPTVFESSIIRARPHPSRADSLFLYYLFGSSTGAHLLDTIRRDAVVAGITGTDLVRLKLDIPHLAEQRAIAHILGTLDDKIELNQRTNETLEEMARALFKSWFVDFDPVRAKAAGRKPVGMDEATAALFPDAFEPSELGEIPRGWRVASALTLFSLVSGGTPKTDRPDYWGGDIKWASAKDISQGSSEFFLLDTERKITQKGLDSSATKIIPANSLVVVARGATCGRHVILGEPMAMNQTCYALVAKKMEDHWFVSFCSTDLINRLVKQAHGSVFDTITTSTFEGGSIILPSSDLRIAFAKNVLPLVERIKALQKENITLSKLRDTLLPRLLSGEISTANLPLLTKRGMP